MNWKCFVLTTCIALAAGSYGSGTVPQSGAADAPQQPGAGNGQDVDMNPNFAGPRRLPATMDALSRRQVGSPSWR
ncbi:MAG: hypothetical protein R3F19_09275 [Verrucomicrobiales bacterium]